MISDKQQEDKMDKKISRKQLKEDLDKVMRDIIILEARQAETWVFILAAQERSDFLVKNIKESKKALNTILAHLEP